MELMAAWCGGHGVEIWAYCLMPNHVHLIAVPRSEDGLVQVAPMLAMQNDRRALLDRTMREEDLCEWREHGRMGYPLGNTALVGQLE